MDCGPAVLRSLLAGFGVEASYGRLREACQTGADGTSIGAIEELATALDLDAEQVMLPADHLLLQEAAALPAVVVVLVGGVTHFVVVWRRHGSRLQVMDPATGRRWPRAERFLSELYLHRHDVAAADWREWIDGPEATAAWLARLRHLGARADEASRVRAAALDAPGWVAPAALDASVRMCRSLAAAGALRRGPDAVRLAERLAQEAAAAEQPQRVVPAHYWSVWPSDTPADSGTRPATLSLRGAVLVRALGRRGAAAAAGAARSADRQPAAARLPAELVAAISQPEPGPLRRLLGFVRAGGWAAPAALAAAAVSAALMVAFEAVLLNGLLRAGGRLAGAGQATGALAALLAFVAAAALLQLVSAVGARDLGRHLETRLRVAFLEKMSRLGDRWFRSRLPSDLAERAHSAVQLRALPDTALALIGSVCELAATVVAVTWLFAGTAPLAAVAAFASVAVPLALQPFLGERDLRMRQHGAALARLQLDALLGLMAVRSHGAEPTVRRQHDEVLRRWQRTGLSRLRGTVAAFGIQSLFAYGLAAALVASHVTQHGIGGGVLLLAYWALKIPALGGELADGLERIPSQRSVAVRLLEPLGAPEAREEGAREEETAAADPATRADGPTGTAVTMRGVTVTGGGQPILDRIDLDISAGTQIAVLGRSGAGKSTLLDVLLGFRRPAEGDVSIDGEPLSAAAVTRLRAATAWVDPAVRLWNESLLDNLRYGGDRQPTPLPDVLAAAGLTGVLESLPQGLATRLGEGGGLVSGGEGQRVRFGRALGRGTARLVVLDEPFRGLDREQRRHLLATTRERWPAATVVCVTHDAAAIRSFDRVVVLEDGRIAESGPPAELADRADSLYGRLLAADGGGWDDPDWRSIRLAGGRIAETERRSER